MIAAASAKELKQLVMFAAASDKELKHVSFQ
jgi:hypothetical protein